MNGKYFSFNGRLTSERAGSCLRIQAWTANLDKLRT